MLFDLFEMLPNMNCLHCPFPPSTHAIAWQEVIRFELPHTTLTSQVYDTIMERLPQAHTCNNTLELPNYCEGLLFSTTSWWYRNEKWQTEAADLDRTFVGSGDKEVLWSILPEDEKEKVLQELRARFRQKLVLAIENANGYDLDEVRRGQLCVGVGVGRMHVGRGKQCVGGGEQSMGEAIRAGF